MKGVKNMIGMNLKALRKAKGYSQEEVAEKMNVSRQSVAKWENDESIPDVIKCSELANLYEISLDELVHNKISVDEEQANGNSIVSNSEKVKRIINVSPQETAVAPNLTVRENLELMARIYGFGNEDAVSKAQKMIEDFELSDIAKSKAKTLSGGWQRRLSIAMALISDPEILFLDEPTLGLDVLARRELWNKIGSLKGKITIILTTHYLEEAESLSDRIGIMVKGNLIAEGTAEELKQSVNANTFEDAFVKIAEEGK